MNPFETYIIRVSDPLSQHTRGVRKSLLVSSVVAIAVARTGLIPTKISALGLEFSQADRGSMLWLMAAVVAFFLISFFVSATSDFMAWRMSQMAKAWEDDSSGYETLRSSHLCNDSLTKEERESLKDKDLAMTSLWRNAGYLARHRQVKRLVGPLSWARIIVEFLVPAMAGATALAFLISTSP